MSGGRRAVPCANAVATHIEPFHVSAFAALRAAPLVPPGICRNPCCSQAFAPAREWQEYCSDACRAMDVAEARRIGHRAAPALLAWQAGRYAAPGTPRALLSRAGRTYYSALAAEWLRDRRARALVAGGET